LKNIYIVKTREVYPKIIKNKIFSTKKTWGGGEYIYLPNPPVSTPTRGGKV